MAGRKRKLGRRAGNGRKRFRGASRRPKARRAVTKYKRSATLGKGFPQKIVMTHKYTTQFTNDSITAPAMTHFIMRANGMYDPEEQTGGHQPLYFDQMSALYDHYTVIGSKIKWTITRCGPTDASILYAVAWLNDDTNVAPTNVFGLNEQFKAKIRTIGIDGNLGNRATYSFTQKFSAKKQYGKGSLNNALLQGTPTTLPVEESFFYLSMNASEAASNIKVRVLAEVEYIAVWTEMKDVAQS